MNASLATRMDTDSQIRSNPCLPIRVHPWTILRISAARPPTRGARFGLAGLTLAAHRAGGTVRLFLPTEILGQERHVFDELGPFGLRDLVFQTGPDGFAGRILIDQSEPADGPQDRRIDRNRVAAQRLLSHPSDGVIVGRLIPANLLGRLLEAFLLHAFQVV